MIVIVALAFAALLVWFHFCAFALGYRRGHKRAFIDLAKQADEYRASMQALVTDALRQTETAEAVYTQRIDQLERHCREAYSLAERLANDLLRERERARRSEAP